jgi:hypothetical protein
MTIRPEHLAALGDLGYNEQEARFLYLVATHSGYFTLRQFLDFTGTAKGWTVHQFTSKSIRLGHVRAATGAYRTSIFNVYSRKIYGALDRDNLRNRRRLSSELVRTRLLILDFVLAHPDLEYLETEADKVVYFRDRLRVPESLIPGRIYKGINSESTTKRSFVDRFPVFLSAEPDCLSGQPVPTFTYCDPSDKSPLHYITHLRTYEPFLRRLPTFEFIYAAPSPVKFQRAEQFYHNLFDENSPANSHTPNRYFRVRQLWEQNQHSLLTRADRDLLRYGNQRYKGEFYDSAYQKWIATNAQTMLRLLPEAHQEALKSGFRTHLLPRNYNIFGEQTASEHRTGSSEKCSAPRSVSRSNQDGAKQF